MTDGLHARAKRKWGGEVIDLYYTFWVASGNTRGTALNFCWIGTKFTLRLKLTSGNGHRYGHMKLLMELR